MHVHCTSKGFNNFYHLKFTLLFWFDFQHLGIGSEREWAEVNYVYQGS